MNFFKLLFKYLLKILFSSKPYFVEVDGVKLFLPPHTGDVLIPAETFLDKNYVPLFKLKRLPRTVIDLGSHIGDFSIWVSKVFNQKKIIAVEMSNSTYKLLKRNIVINNCKNIIAVNKAVNFEGGKFIHVLKIPFLSAANLETNENNGEKVKTISLEEVVSLTGEKNN